MQVCYDDGRDGEFKSNENVEKSSLFKIAAH